MEAEVEFKREMNRNYMVLKAEKGQNERYAVRMLTGNKISGLLPFHEKQVDGEKRYYYDITSKQPLSRILEYRNLTGRELERLISDLIFCLRELERFFLDESCIDLEPEAVYIEPDSFKCCFCFIPGRAGDFAKSFCILSQGLLDHIDHRDGDAVVLAFAVFKESRKENFGIEDIEKCLRRRDERTREQTGGETEAGDEGWTAERTMGRTAGRTMERTGDGETELGSRAKERVRPEAVDAAGRERGPSGRSGPKMNEKTVPESSRSLTTLICIILAAGMVLAPLFSFCMWGLEGILQYKWLLGAAELLMGAILFILMTGARAEAQPSENKEDCRRNEEPWEIYFREENGREADNKEPAWTDDREEYEREPEEMQTILLTARPIGQECRKLVSVSGDMEILLGYFPFIIGKSRDMVDFCLNEPGVSRLHVKIEEQNGEYSATDLNSTNGTRINGKLLEANETCRLPVGGELEIASRKFHFQ